MPELEDVREMLASEHGLAVVSTTQADATVLSSVVNCGVIGDPLTGQPTVALVSRGDAARLRHIRRGSQVTIAVRRGWQWVGVSYGRGASDVRVRPPRPHPRPLRTLG